jgi:N utilization substance protein B
VGTRHRGRERALQCLYQWESTAAPIDGIFERFWRAQEESSDVREFTESLVRGTIEVVEELDPMIAEQASNWRLDRMGMVDRNILRLGLYELLHEPETPDAVAIDEAIELAKRFSGDDAGQFINGVLDGIRRRVSGGRDQAAATEEPSEADS